MMRFIGAIGLAVVLSASSVRADARDDCNQDTDLDRKIRGCTEYINKNGRDSDAYNNRGLAYDRKGDDDRALADYNRAIEINPKDQTAYTNRGGVYHRKGDYDRAIAEHNRAIEIKPKYAMAYHNRGSAYRAKGDYDRAIADYSKAIEINPKYESAYTNRGVAYRAKGDQDRAIADYNKAIEINPKRASPHVNRGIIYQATGDHDRAIADYNKAIEIDPKSANAYRNRGNGYLGKGDHDRALTDFNKAVEIDPKRVASLVSRGDFFRGRGEIDRAIADYNRAIEIDAEDPEGYAGRCAAFENKGMTDRAQADCRTALQRKATSATERQAHVDAQTILTRLQAAAARPPPVASAVVAAPAIGAATEPSSPGRRVALIIGNSTYGSVGRLTNPANDGRAIAVSLRRLGFAEVMERYDVGHAAMGTALKEFGDKSAGADWAVVYYSGHGIELNGVPYLVPIDAKLERDTHVSDETVPLSRVLEKVESARRLRLVILDACRNNPFLVRMVRSAGATRAIGRGLAAVEPEGGVLVAYAAKHGSTAEDGVGANSPFAEALLANLEEPGLEIGFLFRRVRDQVLTATAKRQEPFLYGSLPSESLFFKQAVAR